LGCAVGSLVGATVGRSMGAYVGSAVDRSVGVSAAGELLVSSTIAMTTVTSEIIETHPAIMLYLLRELLPVASVAASSSFPTGKTCTLSATVILRNL
jgi:hypothetical protein